MDLDHAWKLADFYLLHIANHTNELCGKIRVCDTVSETTQEGTFIVQEVKKAEEQLREALRLSKEARERIENLYSHRRKKDQDGTLARDFRVSET